jgi:hypothetical protein
MTAPISQSEARLAVEAIQRRRDDVVAAIDVPSWYWPGMAAGWVGLGLLADYCPPWASTAATVLFGAAHSTIAPRVLTGRHPSAGVSIRDDVVTRRAPLIIIGFLVAMVAVTVGVALLLNADGDRHPSTFASVIVAALVLAIGPRVMAHVRSLAAGRSASLDG